MGAQIAAHLANANVPVVLFELPAKEGDPNGNVLKAIDNLRKLVQEHRRLSGDRRLVVFVDYMQKVPQIPEPENESEKVTFIVNGLKDIALSEDVPMVSIVAADKEGLKASRLRNFHLRGSSAINYEADIILILNEKYHIVAKVNIEFNPYQAQRFRDWVVVSDTTNRLLVYSLATGEQKGRFFGGRAALGRAANLLAVENEAGKLAVHDLTTMQQRAADWLVLLTTLDPATWPVERVMALYACAGRSSSPSSG